MAGTFTLENEHGQLPLATAVLYTCPTSPAAQCLVKLVTVVNTDTSATPITFNLFVKGAGTKRLISSINQILKKGFNSRSRGDFTLKSGETIQGDASVASKVDFTINVVEET